MMSTRGVDETPNSIKPVNTDPSWVYVAEAKEWFNANIQRFAPYSWTGNPQYVNVPAILAAYREWLEEKH